MNSYTKWEVFNDKANKRLLALCSGCNVEVIKNYLFTGCFSKKSLVKSIYSTVLINRAIIDSDSIDISITKESSKLRVVNIVQIKGTDSYHTRIDVMFKGELKNEKM